MKTFTSVDGIKIMVGENAKENDVMTMNAYPKEWWMHISGCPGAHVVICHECDTVPKETKRDAAALAVHYSKQKPKAKMIPVDMARVDQIAKYEKSHHGEVSLEGEIMQLNVFINKEGPRLKRLLSS